MLFRSQRVLLIGVAGALVLRGIFIALGAQLISTFAWAFLLFGAISPARLRMPSR